MKLPWAGLSLFGWSVGYLFVPASMRVSGDQDRAARRLPREATGCDMTLERQYLALRARAVRSGRGGARVVGWVIKRSLLWR